MAVTVGGDVVDVVEAVLEDWAARVKAIAIPAGTPLSPLFGRPCRVVGWSIRETSGSAAAGVDFYDGNSQSNQLLGTVQLPAGTSQTVWFGHPGPYADGGLYSTVRAGAVAGVAYVEDEGT